MNTVGNVIHIDTIAPTNQHLKLVDAVSQFVFVIRQYKSVAKKKRLIGIPKNMIIWYIGRWKTHGRT